MSHERRCHLNLWKQGLGHVPDSVWEQTELETLVLADNGLEAVSEQIGRLQKLRMLDLRWVTTLAAPPWIARLEAQGCLVYR